MVYREHCLVLQGSVDIYLSNIREGKYFLFRGVRYMSSQSTRLLRLQTFVVALLIIFRFTSRETRMENLAVTHFYPFYN